MKFTLGYITAETKGLKNVTHSRNAYRQGRQKFEAYHSGATCCLSNEPVRYDIDLRRLRLFLAVCLLFSLPEAAFSYSVLTHELLIDLTWKQQLQPLLLKRFPGTTPAELQMAQSYAYGGCVIQDLGYYPFAHEFFSNLTHYVRSGDFVTNLLRDARTVDEYAFALGALSHYVGDNIGHHDAINLATAISFPGLERKYGRLSVDCRGA